jgi:hypothetical protein
LKEKVAPKVQADFDAEIILKRTFLFPKSAFAKELRRTLSVELPAGRR